MSANRERGGRLYRRRAILSIPHISPAPSSAAPPASPAVAPPDASKANSVQPDVILRSASPSLSSSGPSVPAPTPQDSPEQDAFELAASALDAAEEALTRATDSGESPGDNPPEDLAADLAPPPTPLDTPVTLGPSRAAVLVMTPPPVRDAVALVEVSVSDTELGHLEEPRWLDDEQSDILETLPDDTEDDASLELDAVEPDAGMSTSATSPAQTGDAAEHLEEEPAEVSLHLWTGPDSDLESALPIEASLPGDVQEQLNAVPDMPALDAGGAEQSTSEQHPNDTTLQTAQAVDRVKTIETAEASELSPLPVAPLPLPSELQSLEELLEPLLQPSPTTPPEIHAMSLLDTPGEFAIDHATMVEAQTRHALALMLKAWRSLDCIQLKDAFRSGILHAPNDGRLYACLGLFLLRWDAPREARAILGTGLSRAPGHPLILAALLEVEVRLGQTSSARTLLHHLMTPPPSDPQGVLRLVRQALQLGAMREAQALLLHAQTLSPTPVWLETMEAELEHRQQVLFDAAWSTLRKAAAARIDAPLQQVSALAVRLADEASSARRYDLLQTLQQTLQELRVNLHTPQVFPPLNPRPGPHTP